MQLRIARPVSQLARSERMIRDGLGWSVLSRFDQHDGFSGVMLGDPALPWHLELTVCHTHPVLPQPTAEDLLVLYLESAAAFETRCTRMLAAGFVASTTLNPWWHSRGRSFADADGYQFVLCKGLWAPGHPPT